MRNSLAKLTKSVKLPILSLAPNQQEAIITTSRPQLPPPGSKPERLRTRLDLHGNLTQISLQTTARFDDRVCAVVQSPVSSIRVGEILVRSPTDWEVVVRYPDLLTARRSLASDSQEYQAVDTLIIELCKYVAVVRDWADAGARQDVFAYAQQLEVLKYRPFYNWFERMVEATHGNRLTQTVAYCQLIALRMRIDNVLALIQAPQKSRTTRALRQVHIRLAQASWQLISLQKAACLKNQQVEYVLSRLSKARELLESGDQEDAEDTLTHAAVAFDQLAK